MYKNKHFWFVCIFLLQTLCYSLHAQSLEIGAYNVQWKEQSKNASESMPCGGGDIGTNVWVENGNIYVYAAQSGWFDENNALLKAGRLKITLSPNPLDKNFNQQLQLKNGSIEIQGGTNKDRVKIHIWVDVFHPIIHVDLQSKTPITATAAYESWRAKDRLLTKKEITGNSWKWIKGMDIVTQKDSIRFHQNTIHFFHSNLDTSVFDYTVRQQGLESIKKQLYNPLKELIFGGLLYSPQMQMSGTAYGTYIQTPYKAWILHTTTAQKNIQIKWGIVVAHQKAASMLQHLQNQMEGVNDSIAWVKTSEWWNTFWKNSFIEINSKHPNLADPIWQMGRNYQLFHYMLACNYYGKYPTKFNGGLFTVDPQCTDSSIHGTPDHRNWGGGTHTAQNQRLVYWNMLKSGDIQAMIPQFDFYNQLLLNANARSRFYWQHEGASFTEQMENFGLPNPAEYGYKRPANLDKGMEHNAWLEYEWDTALEFCLMILESEKYQDYNISKYIPLLEDCLRFFDAHYQYLAKQRGETPLDTNGHLVLFPGSGGETYKLAKNASSTIAALKVVTTKLLASKYIQNNQKAYFNSFLARIPAIPLSSMGEHITIAPAVSWARINNVEPTQLYPVFPWGIYGIGKPDLVIARNTYLYDTLAIKFRSAVGWKQDNIFAAKLGLVEEAAKLNVLKLQNSSNKFPAFWGPGFDWTPDHNWGGSGMIGLQEMLMQTEGKKIYLFAAWPKQWDVHFKLHAPFNTTIEATLSNGKLIQLNVLPKERKADIINLLQD
jgi:hypothetical protein